MRVECESSKLTPQPLFKERMAGYHWERPGSTASDRWKKLGPLAVGRGAADPRVRPNPRWACWGEDSSKQQIKKTQLKRVKMLIMRERGPP